MATTTPAATTPKTSLKESTINRLMAQEPDLGVAGTPIIFAKNESASRKVPGAKMPRRLLTTGYEIDCAAPVSVYVDIHIHT